MQPNNIPYKIKLIHLFILICIIKILVSITDYNMLNMLFFLFIIIGYLYLNNKLELDIQLFENIMKNNIVETSDALTSKDNIFEEKKQYIYDYIESSNIFSNNSELKQNISDLTKKYIDNLSYMYYNTVDNYPYYFDILISQKYEILNLTRTYILSIPQLTSYKSLDEETKQFQILIENIYQEISNKYSYKQNNFISASQYNNFTSFQQY